MVARPPVLRALYDVSLDIVGFDFFNWLVRAAGDGATSVVFRDTFVKTNKWPEATAKRRLRSILQPGPALVGLPASVGNEGRNLWSAHLGKLVRDVRAGKPIATLESVLPPGNAHYTVTLRNTQRAPLRNSNAPAWRAFAAEIGARVIEDYDDVPIGLHERMALYAGAEMNFFVCNGPMHLCSLSPYPLMCFAADKAIGAFENSGIAFGGQYPWMRENQRFIWEPDEPAVIRRHFDAWRDGAWN